MSLLRFSDVCLDFGDQVILREANLSLEPGERVDLFGGITIGRDPSADLRIEDRFASGIHCRVHNRGNVYLIEDMNSTNGTYLNDAQLTGEAPLHDLDEISIGDSSFRFELSVPDSGSG